MWLGFRKHSKHIFVNNKLCWPIASLKMSFQKCFMRWIKIISQPPHRFTPRLRFEYVVGIPVCFHIVESPQSRKIGQSIFCKFEQHVGGPAVCFLLGPSTLAAWLPEHVRGLWKWNHPYTSCLLLEWADIDIREKDLHRSIYDWYERFEARAEPNWNCSFSSKDIHQIQGLSANVNKSQKKSWGKDHIKS